MAIHDGLQIDLADTFEVPDHEGVDRDELACKVSLDMTFPELRIEPFEEADLLFRKLHAGFPGMLLETEKSLVFG